MWQQIAENLPVGHKVRQSCHECGNTNDAAVVNHNIRDYSFYCYACGHIEVESKGKQTLEQLKKLQELNDAATRFNSKSVELPDDYTNDIPLVGRLWLYNGGISPTVWSKHRIGWSESLQRVILPVYNTDGNLVWYQARAVLRGQKPKYIQPAAPREHVIYEVRPIEQHSTTCVVVEDILSAIRVGRFIPTYSILGTKITSTHVNKLAKYSKVVTWMDSDRAGRKSAYNIRKSVGMLTEVDNILTEQDPKRLSDNEIKEQLCRMCEYTQAKV